MFRRTLRRVVKLGVVIGLPLAAWRALQARRRRDEEVRASGEPAWPPIERTTPPPAKADVEAKAQTEAVAAPPRPDAAVTWVEPEAGGACPATHPVKAKLSSRIFHVPGGAMYDRTKPDRCYATPAAAEADGFTRAKR